MTGQYRGLIEGYSHVAQCLYDLKNELAKKKSFKWTSEHDAAFLSLKEKLTKPPVVWLPDPKKPFIVRTEASGSG